MSDMLVRLYHNELLVVPTANRHDGVLITRALSFDAEQITGFVAREFHQVSHGWDGEVSACLNQQPTTCFIATYQQQLVGFACYDATAKGMIGPLGVSASYRNRGIARDLLMSCFDAMKHDGYAYAVIGWVSSTDFYTKVCNASEIEGSSPGIYSRLIGQH